jgi:hypothetical protein
MESKDYERHSEIIIILPAHVALASGKFFAYVGVCNTYVGSKLRWVQWVHSYAVIMAVVTVLISFYIVGIFLHLCCVLFCVPTFNKTHDIDFANERDLILITD